jgi:protein-S-isoprenylcysteine O-methyltransferase Ste14
LSASLNDVPFLSDPLWPQATTGLLVGTAPVVIGLAFAVWARIFLGRFWSGSITLKESHQLMCVIAAR